jgi:hypothetical protein
MEDDQRTGSGQNHNPTTSACPWWRFAQTTCSIGQGNATPCRRALDHTIAKCANTAIDTLTQTSCHQPQQNRPLAAYLLTAFIDL